jgi:formiminotetrahydrofolate cyclodeaminase
VSVTDERLASMSVEGFLEVLGSDAPTPGGGAAGAIAGATGAALIAMVGRLTMGKEGFEDLEDRMRAFDGVMVAFKMPKETDVEKAARSAAIQAGYEQAASVPLEIARAAVDLMELAEDATAMGNPQAASDGVSGAAHLSCAAACAIANVEINAASLKDPARRARLLDEVAVLRGRADQSLRDSLTAFPLRLPS